MYKFITKEEREAKDKKALIKEEMLWDIVELRNTYVDALIEYNKAIKILCNKNIPMVMIDLYREQSAHKTVVSYLNYILDVYRIDLEESKKKPSAIKAFNNLPYNKINSYVIDTICSRILPI